MMFDYSEVFEKSLKYFNGDELAANVFLSKYAQKEGDKYIEKTPDDMHKRLAKEFTRIECGYQADEVESDSTTYQSLSDFGKQLFDKRNNQSEFNIFDDIYDLFERFKYIVPQGSVMSMLGSSKVGSLSNCFVVGQPKDSYGGIIQKDEQLAQLMKRRGGVGIDISTLRPSGTRVSNAAQTSTGAVSFMERYSNTTREVAQGGRRGALMISIDVRHPDVFEFVKIKQDLSKVTGANISVHLRDDFMEAVKNDSMYTLRFPVDSTIEKSTSAKHIKARELWQEIVKSAHNTAEPGLMFIDKHWDYSPDGVYPQYKGITTNPCGEIFMQEYDACRLMALNLFSFVKNPFTDKAEFDFKHFYEVAYMQQRLADDLVDLELEHIQRIINKINADEETTEVKRTELELWENIYNVCKSGRRTGCGFTALGDTLAALGFKYDSQDSQEFIEKMMDTKLLAELDCSIDLSVLRGSFEGFDSKKEFGDTYGKNKFYQFVWDNFPYQAERMCQYGRRNISFSTVAPTGSVSILTQTTSGLEPLFQPYYFRRKKINPNDEKAKVDFVDNQGDKWQQFPVCHPKFEDWVELGDIKSEVGEDVQKAFELSPWYKSTANDINWEKRVEIQSIIQKYTTHSISSTINLPKDVSVEEVSNIYFKAWELGLKGVTVYRDGSRDGVLITKPQETSKFTYNNAPKRPKCLPCDIYSTTSKGVKWNIIVGTFDGFPYEVFAVPHFTNETHMELCKVSRGRYDLIKNGETYSEDITSQMTDEQEIVTRLISIALRHGADIHYIYEQLNKAHGDITSFSKGISRTLVKYLNKPLKLTCSDCKSENILFEEGCSKCKDCGSSKCG